ncbi:hypothetical protein SAMN04488120_11424 [Fontimonas thermophila]|uniref:Uncharacterized protein n=1 Tax=Fontimonas thermophila TaxID=1076937 RepID=A0A1I2K943_9GAMM|nr:hypothetical protein SAMN04488120_11424 [Fontimonas thermophila]
MRRVRVIAAALAAAASVLAGCGDLDIGEGTAPTRLTIHYNGIEGGVSDL